MPPLALRETRSRPPSRSNRSLPGVLALAAAICLTLIGTARAQETGGAATDSVAALTTAGAATIAAADSVVPPAPAPVTDLTATDVPNDKGMAIALEWKVSPDEAAHP